MTRTKSFAMLAIACLVAFSACTEKKAADVTLQVKTQYGVLEGFEEDGVKKFLGVPFAQAPVGELRWKAPQPVQAWEGVRPAKEFGDDPMQLDVFGDMAFRGPKRSEDCLYLNIWTTATTTADALPVLIYFNGGGLMAGSGSEPRYDGSSIAKEGVIGVTANYREGVFGFFAHPDLTAASDYKGSGNYGFLDQVAAIQWVKDNIAAFGGDPAKITIVGESAGSFSVSLLMCSPLSKDNIAGAMLSSGAEVLPYQPASQADADAAGAELLKQAGIASLADALALSADSLQKLLPPRGMANVVIDGYFMKKSADEVFENNEQAQVPLLAGWNSLEGHPAQALGGQAPTLLNYKNAMKAQFGDMTERWPVVCVRRLPRRKRPRPSSPRLPRVPSIRLISSMRWVPSTPTSTTTGRMRTTLSRSCSLLTMPTSARPAIPTARAFPSGQPSRRRISTLRL